jgi:preprotein translocase subunit SecD
MAGPINYNPIWKYFLIIFVIAVGFLYAAPNLYGEYPAVQIMGTDNVIADENALQTAVTALKNAGITYRDVALQDQRFLFRFTSTDVQLQAKDVLQQALGDNYLVALNLSSASPDWLSRLGAMPMRLGLDLRGGVHFLMQVDVNTVMQQRIEGDLRGIGQSMRDERIRYSGITRKADNQIVLQFRAEDMLNQAEDFVSRHYNEFTWVKSKDGEQFLLTGVLSPAALLKARNETLEQSMNTLRNE